ncbi:hypothetical protein Hs30E_18640 [Lactococcus hodotermopsidis]|uniref:Uncharacterized protein n=1 Tax=Pseudolactococcus hodotermopsidis TaxID=2709157 RepID=A0A6A0BF32_9LACT|nr:hypothetical protein [Lactococcus hodotermopsidis]GFH43313.1 hypothetical protein Hs30E_18640 [Lactococcus hodotermopsidis]
MTITSYFKDIKNISTDLISETADLKKNLDNVKFELEYAKMTTTDIKKDIKEYQFQAKPRLKTIHEQVTKIQNELSQ